MKRNSKVRQDISKRNSVETEEERAENRALWNTSRNGSRRRETGINRNRMRAMMKIRRKKRERRTRNTEVGRETGEEDLMINGVKRRRKIEKNKSRDFLLVNGEEKIIVDAKKSSLSGMELAIGRLKRGKRRKGVKVIDKASVNDALVDFGNEIEVRDRAVAGEIINRKRVFLVKGSDNGMFEGMTKGGFENGKINESGDRKDENVETRFEKSSGDEIKRASSIRRGQDSRTNLWGGSMKKGRKKRRGGGKAEEGEEKKTVGKKRKR